MISEDKLIDFINNELIKNKINIYKSFFLVLFEIDNQKYSYSYSTYYKFYLINNKKEIKTIFMMGDTLENHLKQNEALYNIINLYNAYELKKEFEQTLEKKEINNKINKI